MRTPSETQNFITRLLIDDLNMLTVELRRGKARMQDDTDKILPAIEITFEDIGKSNYLDTLNAELEGFLQGQKFFIAKCEQNSLIVVLL